MRCCVLVVALAACTEPLTGASRQAVESDSCTLLPEPQDLARWDGTPLFPASTVHAVTLTANPDPGRFVAYGIDPDAGTVDWVVIGPGPERDTFVARIESIHHELGLFSTVVGKVGGGDGPRPPGDDLIAPSFLIATATAIADAAFRDPTACQ